MNDMFDEQRPSREREIFLEALDRPAGPEREAYLDTACAADKALREQMEAMLAAYQRNGSFLDQPAIIGGPAHSSAGTPAVPGQAPGAAAIIVSVSEKAGDRIGRYKLLEQIGEGGCGVVYMAEQEEPVRRRVALKVIKLGMDTKEVIARFEAERQALAMMDHPNIAKVLDAGATEPGRPYFVMELVRGTKITDYCDQNNLPAAERLQLFIQVCHAIQHAHQKGIIHRDIKPSNILVSVHDDVPVPKVIDFGIAKAFEERLTDKTLFTRFQQHIGTPCYMSPEQAGLSGLDIDTRSDIYALGVLLYELLTGCAPFDPKQLAQAGLEEILRRIREEEPPKPSTRLTQELVAADVRRLKPSATGGGGVEEEIRASSRRLLQMKELISLVRGDLDWIVMKCLEKNRARRYETANALAQDLEHHLEHEPVTAAAPGAVYRFQKFVRRNQAALATASALATLLVIGVVVSTWQAVRATRAQALAERREAEARANLWAAYFATAHSSRTSGQPGRRFAALEAVSNAAAIRPSLELRGEAASALALVDVRPVREWEGWAPGTTGLAIDRRFERYARDDGNGHVSVRRVSDDHELLLLEGKFAPSRFSPDGRFLLGERCNPPTFRVWNLDTGQLVVESSLSVSCAGPDFHPHAPVLAACGAAGAVEFFDLSTGKRWSWAVTNIPYYLLRFRPDGKQMALSSLEPPAVQVYDVESGNLVAWLAHSNAVRRPNWSPDGHWLAAPCADNRIYLWNMREGAALDRVLEGHDGVVTHVCFDPQGEFLVSQSWDGTTALWSLPLRSLLLKCAGTDSALSFSADGRWLGPCVAGRTVRLLEVERAPELRILPANVVAECNGAFSPDGRWVVLGGDDGVQCWDTRTAQRLWCEPTGYVRYVAFRPDGGVLLTTDETGAREWPWLVDPPNGVPRLGHPRQLSVQPFSQAEYSRDGSVLVTSESKGLRVLDARASGPNLLPMPMCNFAAVSPDGRWAVAAPWGKVGMKVWELPGGREVFQLTNANPALAFTRDGRWLVMIWTDFYQCLEVGTWRTVAHVSRHPVFAHALAVSGDNRCVAVEQGRGRLQLCELPTFRMILDLDAAGLPLSFSPDGALLLTRRSGGQFGLWDLRRIREELTPLGLGW